jgi:predicted GNAT family N-acyltransferase
MIIKLFKPNDSEFAQVMDIRTTVFENEQGAIASEEIDCYDSDSNTVYALVYDGEKPVATGRIAKTPKGFKIGRIAVLKNQRGKGTGKVLVTFLCDEAFEMGASIIFVDAQLHAVEFYKKLGFEPTGDEKIIDRGIEHLPMRKIYEN